MKRAPKKNAVPKKRKTIKVKVPGHWVFPKDDTKPVRWRKGYSYKRLSQKGIKKPKILPLKPGYKRYHMVEPEGRVAYTYKIEALVQYQRQYTTKFALDKDIAESPAIEFYHSKFKPTVAEARANFREEIKILESYGHIVEYLSVSLYRVSGEGSLREKQWRLMKTYAGPKSVR